MTAALSALDEQSNDAAALASLAKAKANDTIFLCGNEGVQMHGGVGMTDEFDIGLFMKRDRALAEFLGDASYHADRVATLSGY